MVWTISAILFAHVQGWTDEWRWSPLELLCQNGQCITNAIFPGRPYRKKSWTPKTLSPLGKHTQTPTGKVSGLRYTGQHYKSSEVKQQAQGTPTKEVFIFSELLQERIILLVICLFNLFKRRWSKAISHSFEYMKIPCIRTAAIVPTATIIEVYLCCLCYWEGYCKYLA